MCFSPGSSDLSRASLGTRMGWGVKTARDRERDVSTGTEVSNCAARAWRCHLPSREQGVRRGACVRVWVCMCVCVWLHGHVCECTSMVCVYVVSGEAQQRC